MTKMQKDYIAKWLKVVGIILYCVATIVFMIAGGETRHWIMWVGLVMLAVPSAFIIFACAYVPFATMVWHWRLMGECKTEWESETLQRWWFWMYRSERWQDYLWQEVAEEYPEDTDYDERRKMGEFIFRLAEVKKPRWL